LRRELERVEVPGEREARERSWAVVAAAFAQREPARKGRSWKPLAAVAVALVALAGLLSPPGRAVLDEIREVVGVAGAEPALFSLPSSGRLLVSSAPGTWVVDPDGSKRLVGGYREASWSPFGAFVVATRPNELVALEPDGDLRWKLTRPGVSLPRWGGTRTDTRVAYLSGDDLRVVAGNGQGDRLLARRVRPVPPAWRPGAGHVLAWVDEADVVVAEADTKRVLVRFAAPAATQRLEWSRDGRRLLVQARRSLRVHAADGAVQFDVLGREAAPITAAALAPGGSSLAFVQSAAGQSHLWLIPRLVPDASAARRVFSGAGRFTDLEWSPDGRWLLLGWRDADQWVFVRSERVRGLRAVNSISQQFEGGFPNVGGWCCAG
jgi:hypothetical protein